MTLLGVILVAIGSGDILRVLIPRRWNMRRRMTVLSLGCLAVLVTAAAVALIPWWLTLVGAPAVAAWFASLQIGPALPVNQILTSRRRRAGMIMLFLLLVAFAVLTAELTTGPAFSTTPRIGRNSEETLTLAAGLTLFLVVSSNGLVRAALKRDSGALGKAVAADGSQLKGGRLIGPLERLTLSWLLILGAYPVAAGLLAAKGIVRFPEIQADQQHGNKAEYFLVGSFVSWALAIGAAGLLQLSLVV